MSGSVLCLVYAQQPLGVDRFQTRIAHAALVTETKLISTLTCSAVVLWLWVGFLLMLGVEQGQFCRP
jgi:hypothetical protein